MGIEASFTEDLKLLGRVPISGPWYSGYMLSEQAFEELCQAYPEWIMEQEPNGKIALMSPLHYDSGFYEIEVGAELRNYVRQHKLGKVFSSSTGFRLPDGSLRSPDAAFVSNEKIKELPPDQRKQFARIVPDFVIEVRSDTDHLPTLQQKMISSWLANGVALAWLIDPLEQKTYLYFQDGNVKVIDGFDQHLNGGPVLPGFSLDLSILLE
jgi:Uma2 family endonuclease